MNRARPWRNGQAILLTETACKQVQGRVQVLRRAQLSKPELARRAKKQESELWDSPTEQDAVHPAESEPFQQESVQKPPQKDLKI